MNYLSLTVQNYHTHKRKKKEKHQRQMSDVEKLVNGAGRRGGGGWRDPNKLRGVGVGKKSKH